MSDEKLSEGGRPESRERFRHMYEIAEELRKNIYMFWKHSKQEFGTAGMQKVCRDTMVVFIEKAMLAGERDMAERAAQLCDSYAKSGTGLRQGPTQFTAKQLAVKIRALAGVPAELCGKWFASYRTEHVHKCVLPKGHAGDHDDAADQNKDNTELLLAWLADIWNHRGATRVHYGWWQTVYNQIQAAYRARYCDVPNRGR